jgi:hypothetical protein
MKRLLIACAGVTALAGAALGQGSAAIMRQGVPEVGGFVGASYGILQTHVMGGGNVVYSLRRTFMPFGEVSYFPGVGQTVTTSVSGLAGATQTHVNLPLTDFNAGFHIRFPIARSRVIPYGVMSVGGLHFSDHSFPVTFVIPGTGGQTTTVQAMASGETEFAVSGGGGIRYYTTEHYGFRAEFKAYKPTNGTYTNAFYRVAFGFFYQF